MAQRGALSLLNGINWKAAREHVERALSAREDRDRQAARAKARRACSCRSSQCALSCVAAPHGKLCGSTKCAANVQERHAAFNVFICSRFSLYPLPFPFFICGLHTKYLLKLFHFSFFQSALFVFICAPSFLHCLFEVKNLSKLSLLPFIYSMLAFFILYLSSFISLQHKDFAVIFSLKPKFFLHGLLPE